MPCICHPSSRQPLVFFQCADISLKSLITWHREGSLKELSPRVFHFPFLFASWMANVGKVTFHPSVPTKSISLFTESQLDHLRL